MSEPYFDFQTLTFRGLDEEGFSERQKANARLYQALLRAEFARGFDRGRVVGRMERDFELRKQSILS